MMDGAGQPFFPKAAAATDVVLPEARLRFVHTERDGIADRLASPILRQTLLVESVPSLVEHPEK